MENNIKLKSNILKYAVMEDTENALNARARFFDVEEAEWYAKNLWKAAKAKGFDDTIYRVFNTQAKRELTIYGSIAPLDLREVSMACMVLSA